MGDEDATGTEVEAPKINPITRQPWTEEDRQRQSERAKEQVALGQIGGARHGRRRKVPAYAVIAAEAQKNGRILATTLLAIAKEGPTPKLKMDAIKMLVDIEQKAKQERRDEEDHLQRLPRDQLMRAVLERLEEITGEDYDIEISGEEVQELGDDESEVEQAQTVE